MENGFPFSVFRVSVLCLSILCSIPAQSKVVDRIVAIVNNEVITEYELKLAMAVRPKATRGEILGAMIDQKLLEQDMKKTNIEVTDDELARAMAGILQQNGIPIEILRAELAGKGIDFEEYKERLKNQIRQTKFVQQHFAANAQVSDEDLQKYKSGQAPVVMPSSSVHLAGVFLPLDPSASSKKVRSAVLKARKMADKARHSNAGMTKFEDWGTKTMAELPAAVAADVAKMPVGGVSDPIVVPNGVYVVKVIETTASPDRPAEKGDDILRENLYNNRLQQEIDNYVMKLRRKAYIDIRE